jgi:nucleoside-diphosphate-sugar epimerase
LVYGPGVGGNFLSMLKWIDRGIPLPLASVHNRRSLIGLDNLVGLLATCLSHPGAPGELFLAADGEDLSTPDLMRRAARALGTRARLLPFPLSVLRMTARLSGLGGACERLCGSLQIDASKSRRLLGWQPALSVDEGLQTVAAWYRHRVPECRQ